MYGGNCGPRFGWAFGMRPESFGFDPGAFWGGRGKSRGGPFGGSRMFDQGHLKFVILRLLDEKPRHGYEIIKEIEERFGGMYSPSPGTVYPTLTMLEDMGLIAESKSKDTKKVYEATAEGRAHLEENSAEVEDLIERLEGHGHHRRRGQRPEIGRAIGNLMAALRNRIAHEGWNERLLDEVVDILDEAAQRIERVRDAKRDDD